MQCTKSTCCQDQDPIKALDADKTNPAKSNVFLKYSIAAVASGIGIWLAGYLFTKGAIAAGGK